MRNKKLVVFFVFALVIVLLPLNITNFFAAEEVVAPARSMIVIEGNTSTVLYHFKKDLQVPMASVTKIITAIVAIENTEDINEIVKISPKAVGIEGTSIYLKNGESLKMYDLLLGLILASGNDCSVAIAEHVGGSGGEKAFVQMMNDLMLKLELTNTHFDNPHGLDSATHYTTAYDLAMVTAYALKNPIFKEISTTKYATIEGTEIYQTRYLKNKNKLLFSMDGCVGVKTGFTDNAGRCLVNAHEKDDMQIISVVLNCGPMFEEAQRLTNNALKEYTMKEFITPYSFVSNISVTSGEKDSVGVVAIDGFKLPVKKSQLDNYTVEYDLPKEIQAPVNLNQQIGKVVVKFNDDEIYSNSLYSIDSVKNIDLKYFLEHIIEKWIP